MSKNTLAAKLAAPIEVSWKVQSISPKHKAQMVAFIDSRDVQNRLDEAVGIENWKDEYHVEAGKLFCQLSIRINDEWITKTDVGKPSKMDAEKGEASDAFKRAAVKWGVGRYLYDMEVQWVDTVEHSGKRMPVDSNGNKLWNRKAVSDYCNSLLKNK